MSVAKSLGLFMIAMVLTACAHSNPSPVSDRNSDLTHGNVQMNLTVGTTTKAEVIEHFGSPNITTRDGSGSEVWTYQRQAQVSQSSSQSSGWSILLAGGSASAAGFESSSRMMTLIIKFDDNEVVSDFRSRASNF